MQFQSVASLWFALALPAIALMYMLKRTYDDTIVPSHLLWRKALREQEANRPWQKLRSRLLMLLQLLAAALLVFALTDPVLLKGGTAAGHAVIVIDRSASMSALAPQDAAADEGSGTASAAGGRTMLQAAAELAGQWLDDQPAGREVTLIGTGPQPEVLAARTADRSALRDALSRLEPVYGVTDDAAALSLADSLAREEEEGEIVLFSDGRWLDESSQDLALHAPFSLFDVGTEKGSAPPAWNNVSIAHFGIKPEPEGKAGNRGLVTIRNESGAPRNVTLEVFAEGKEGTVARAQTTVPPGEWKSVTLGSLPDAAYYKAVLRSARDVYAADDTAYQFPPASQTHNVLLVTGGNLFLDKALQLAGARTIKANASSFEPDAETVKAVDWVVLDGVSDEDIRSAAWRQLLDAKPVWRIVDADAPPEGTVARTPSGGEVKLKPHEVTRYTTFEETHIGRIVTGDGARGWGEPIVTYGGLPAIYADIRDGRPMLTFSFSLSDTDLPLRPEFPILVMQAAEWMGGGDRRQLGVAVAGGTIEVPLSPDADDARFVPVETAVAEDEAEERAADRTEGRLSGTQTVPAVPGLYRFVETDMDGRELSGRFLAITADPRESLAGSSLRVSRAAEGRAEGSSAAPDGNAAEAGPAAKPAFAQGASLAPWAALALLLLLAAEWEVYRRGRSG
ncbi:hypothetical protein PACILC2_10680 [Paenibacillus cisolokensis]|uniref:VWFA domain-containing protein n=1 Tax=Paenibacillus cisolokensis TaxID=1658519 RepID=A0ABQ4N2W2_9BACL|nr:VWA domain-containing protein [Paenibacillus cisolokensis]GIQ62500.1 hypothetical protein PACILC2_10680 [Paenibacillus cisolokensis]